LVSRPCSARGRARVIVSSPTVARLPRVALGPGVTSPKSRYQGCEPVTQALSRTLLSSRARFAGTVEEEVATDGVADATLQNPQRCLVRLAFGDLAVEVGPAIGVGAFAAPSWTLNQAARARRLRPIQAGGQGT
jgi:hypothetical protein